MPTMIVVVLALASAARAEDPEKKLEVALTTKIPPIAAKALAAAESPNLPDRPLTLVKIIKPIYPEAGRAEALSGAVQLEVTVDEEGEVDTVKTLSGHPLLANAAASAIRRWTYRCAVVNGKPMRSTTVVKLNFKAPE